MTTTKKQTPSAEKPKPDQSSTSKALLNDLIQNEISRISELQSVHSAILEEFAQFVIANHKKKPKLPKVVKPKPLTLAQLKAAVYEHFHTKDTTALKKSSTFQLATSGMGKLDLSKKDGWEALYRKFIGVLPGEDNETGKGCINGINIFKYDLPWRAFGLNRKTASTEDVKSAYRELSKIYHPDNRETGNADVFNRLTVFYKSLTERF
ncbi:DnaJ domain-containing protein [Myxacorys almedinensis]|uniref:DnaJ domain-containing protein n=1 Tax=Myxacorys almedinensis A TaxID=2690445 RepID=A0A8J7Z757_9CYAN|nr:DnaJ domain-containing protein [Myxacorys almedinensis]NDJ19151.1 DnaJ domain-containing protein [Myxacorys almedinensis A]